MLDKLLAWVPTPKDITANAAGNAVYGAIGGGIALILSAIAASIAWPHSDAQWVGWFLYALLILSATWALSGVAVMGWRWRSAITATPQAPPISEAALVRSAAPVPSVQLVSFVIEGNWLNTPFQRGDGGLAGLGLFSEDVYLTLTANDFLEVVRVEIVATDSANRKFEYWHAGKFQGSVTRGMKDTIRVFRRTFDFEPIAIRNEGGGHTHSRRRRMRDVLLFDGTGAEAKIGGSGIIAMEVRIHRKGTADEAPEGVSFVLDADNSLAPTSRLVVTGGPLQIKIPNNYVRQFNATMINEDITDDTQGGESAVEPLLAFVERGFAVRERFMKDNDPLRIGMDHQIWLGDIQKHLEGVGRPYVLRFRAARSDGRVPANRSAQGGHIWAEIGAKIDALNQIISELRGRKE